MKLLIVYPEEFRGHFAREYHIYRLANSLALAGCEVILGTGLSKRFPRAEDLGRHFGEAPHPRLQVRGFRRKFIFGLRWGAWFYMGLERWLKRQRNVDLVYTMHVKAAHYFCRRHPKIPVAFEAHEIFADTYAEGSPRHRKLACLEQEVHSNASAVVAISSYLAACLRERYGSNCPMQVQHDGIDSGLAAAGAGNTDLHELIYVGSLQPWKGVPVAVEAMRLLPDYHLTVVGGHGRELESLKSQAPSNVAFTGHLKREELPTFMNKAGIGLIPNLLHPRSALYTFPLKLLEYSAAGKGIVASRIPAFEGLDTDGWVKQVESGSPEQLAAGVRMLAEAGPDREKAKRWAGQFAWEKQGQHLKDFLETVLRGGAGCAR